MARDDRIDAAYFNKPIKFQSIVATPDTSGGSESTGWTNVYSCFAHIDSFSGSNAGLRSRATRPFAFLQLYPQVESVIIIRYQATVPLTQDMVILYKSRRYQILGMVIPHEEQVTVVIPVVLYQAPGMPN